MPINDSTVGRAYQKPHPDAPSQKDDINRLRAALDAIDTDVSDLLDAVADLVSDVASKAPLASPALTSNPTAPTQPQTDNSTRLATTEYVRVALAGISRFDEASVASASTCDIGAADGHHVEITGTTAISSFGSGADRLKFVRFAGALTLTHNGTSLILPGGASITTAAGDTCIAISNGVGQWRVFNYERASGKPIVPKAGLIDAGFTISSIASASTTNVGGVNDVVVQVTGTTTITSLGAVANVLRIIVFAASLTLTHNATSLILPTAANIVTAANDVAIMVSDGSGNWRCLSYQPAAGISANMLGKAAFGPFTDIASATTTNLGTVATIGVNVTGTTTITGFGTSANLLRIVTFAGALTLTHHATSLKLPGGANIVTAAGDRAVALSDNAGNWTVVSYTRAAGRPLDTGTSETLTKGFKSAGFALNSGNPITSGTITPDPADGNLQHAINGGAFQINAPTATGDYSLVVELTNNGSAGAVTLSGFTKVSGDTLTTTNTKKFWLHIMKLNGSTRCFIEEL